MGFVRFAVFAKNTHDHIGNHGQQKGRNYLMNILQGLIIKSETQNAKRYLSTFQ